MRERQEHGAAGCIRLADDAAGDDVARREIAVGMVPVHERFAADVDQPRAFAAQRLGDQKSRSIRLLERGRMELHELQIGDARARVVGESDAVAGGDRRDSSSR